MHHRPSGFTLIELMIVVAIIGILLAIVLPVLNKRSGTGCSYPADYIQKAREYRACASTPNCRLTAEEHTIMMKVEAACHSGASPGTAGTPPKVEQ